VRKRKRPNARGGWCRGDHGELKARNWWRLRGKDRQHIEEKRDAESEKNPKRKAKEV
jgi:hypothetical protein